MLEQAEKALHMSVNLTSQLLTFSKGGKPLKKRIALRPVIENSVKFALSGSRVDYRIKIDQELWIVEADEGQIGQVIQNLVLNAEQAMPMGGTITITAENVGSLQKGLPLLLQHGNYIVISIQDRGIGIPEQYLSKIFDPYFTTKDKGSGLGLATSYSIIKNHGGLIDVKSRLGEGTTFIVYLPAVEVVEKVAATVSEDVRPPRKGRILLMDDEEIVRDIAGIMIRSLGHEVEFAADGKEAIEKYQESKRSDRPFDIVIMDLTVRGGMGGEEAIKELLQIDPDIKAIVPSGYTDSSAISEYKTTGFKACLAKAGTDFNNSICNNRNGMPVAERQPSSGPCYIHCMFRVHKPIFYYDTGVLQGSAKAIAQGRNGVRSARRLGNSRVREMHDLLNVTRQCQTDEIAPDRRFYFADLEAGLRLGYDYCAYCFDRERSKR